MLLNNWEMKTLLYLQPVAEPGSKENKRIIMSIMNSHPSYNRLVLGKELLTSGYIEQVGIHKGNDSGTAFWRKHGYINIKSTTDKHQKQVDIYEKVLKE